MLIMQCLEPICVHLKRLIRFLVEDQNLGGTEISLRCGQLDFFLTKTIDIYPLILAILLNYLPCITQCKFEISQLTVGCRPVIQNLGWVRKFEFQNLYYMVKIIYR